MIDAATGNVLRELSHPSPPDYDFGSAVALSGGIAVVGEPYANGVLPLSGAAYVFDATTDQTFTGTSGNNVFTFSTDATNHYVSVTLAGQPTRNYTYPASNPVTLTFNGLGGNDSITITGGDGTDTAIIRQTGKGTVKVVGTGYTVNGSNMETVSVLAGGGSSQVAKLWDTIGNDVFTARTTKPP